ncbi:histidine phosphatase family protein [Hymenobacter sp. BT683]|uniref:Histidine phosphatase family protein n=1 Tax=Hymenobacter jeongseonensis TaxID=2791027 RepID=A0ABS0IH16_9BACT|nr:histidine phosphatase family protein [Hymenobacter jeongseonensis]MBF9237646.1 histidine phosphatase family protein [Hymenobacter jeongseonensis]
MTVRFFLNFFLLAGLVILGCSGAQAQARSQGKAKPLVTTIYLVRHAEKDTVNNPKDPALSAVGEVRAIALRKELARRKPVALFTTDTKRTRSTLAPLAAAVKVEPQVYNPRETTTLAQRLRQEYMGKTVVVVGHSNTLIPLIESLGGSSPVEQIGDNEYDYLFTVRITEGALPTVGVQGYGPERRLLPADKVPAVR